MQKGSADINFTFLRIFVTVFVFGKLTDVG